MVDGAQGAAADRGSSGVFLPGCQEVIQGFELGIGRNHQGRVVIGQPGNGNNVGHGLRIVAEFDGPHHHSTGRQEGVFAAGGLNELAQTDCSACSGNVDHLGVIDDAAALERLLPFTGKAVPSATRCCRGYQCQLVPGRARSAGGAGIQERQRGHDGHDQAEDGIA